MSDYQQEAQAEMWDCIAAQDSERNSERERTIERWMRESAVMTTSGLSRAEAERAYDAGAR